MDILGIGPLEFFFILLIILLVAGPKDIARAARGFGRFLNRLYRSPNYQAIRQASNEIRNLPQRLAREAQLDELRELEELKETQRELEEASRSIGGAVKPFKAWVEELPSPPKTEPATPRPASEPPPAPPMDGEQPKRQAPPPPTQPDQETTT